MRVIHSVPATIGALLAASVAQAQYLVNELSFGSNGRVGLPESPDHIPHFITSGTPARPDILSNKVILTPIHPGNQRGAIWGERPLNRPDWTADVDFRASGDERAGGNLNIWLVTDGNKQVGSNSVYTVGRFEGLVLVLDQHGNHGGMLRGFLNDGSTDYSKQQSLDNLAFGHCQFAYRNLGRPAQIKLLQNNYGFKVEIDGRRCFDSNKITIPNGYNFGVTAATPENPDSFEIFKLVVMSESTDGRQITNDQGSNQNSFQYSSQHQIPAQGQDNNQGSGQAPQFGEEAFKNIIPDQDADIFQTSKTQFQDLHNRLQQATHQISAVYRGVSKHHEMDEARHHEIKDMFTSMRAEFAKLDKLDQLSDLQNKIAEIQRDFANLRDDVNRRMSASEAATRGVLSDHHRTLSQSVSDNLPSHGRLIFILVGSQIVLAVAYIVYKRRKAAGPKKYL